MSDLTERLEHYARTAMPHYPNDICSQAKQEIVSLRAQLASARKALQFIADGYENHDINHVDYRVTVYQGATDALKDLP